VAFRAPGLLTSLCTVGEDPPHLLKCIKSSRARALLFCVGRSKALTALLKPGSLPNNGPVQYF